MQKLSSIIDIFPSVIARSCFYFRSQKWDKNRLESYQDEMLKKLIRHAGFRVPYYRKLFKQHSIDPMEFRGRSDMPFIPLLDKETLRTRTTEFIAEDVDEFKAKWSMTSGSTGTPLQILLSADSRSNDLAATLRAYYWSSYYPGKKVFTVKNFLSETWEFNYNLFGTSLNFDATKLSRNAAIRVWQEINRLKPSIWMGYPFQMIMLGLIAREENISIYRPKFVVTVGDSLVSDYRSKLEDIYKAKIFDFYGMTENTAMITECEFGNKHIIEDFAFHEIIGDGGNVVTDGNGELISTSYYNYAMPLIRYKTRDLVKGLRSNRACQCNRNFRMVKEIRGRKEDFIQTPEGRFINLFEEPISMGKGIMLSQYVQDSIDHLHVNIIPASDFDKKSLKNVEKYLRDRIGNTIRIEFRIVPELEKRDSGKTPFVISKIRNTPFDN